MSDRDSAPQLPPGGPAAGAGPRETARERARLLRETQRRQDRKRRWIVQGGILGGSLAILAVVAIVLLNAREPSDRGPDAMDDDGIRIDAALLAAGEVLQTSKPTAPPTEAPPTPTPTADPADVVDIRIYVDYLCPNCGTFQKNNAEQIRTWVETGAATVEYHPIAVLTTKSSGTQYSLRAANAAACVADFTPEVFFQFNEALFAQQPDEGTPGLDDAQLLQMARDSGAGGAGLADCVENKRYRAWVLAATNRALNGPLPDADIEAVAATPTILVNGREFAYTADFDPAEFSQFVVQAAGDAFAENSTPTPTPVPSEQPAPAG
jgi:protein-disulfide isomerase